MPAALLLTVLCSPAGSGRAAPPPDGLPETGALLRDLDGQPLELDALLRRGPVVLAFWATWCGPCMAEVVRLCELHRQRAPRAAVLAVNEDEAAQQAAVRAFAHSRGLACPVVPDPRAELAARYHPELTLPYTVLLGPGGRVVHRHAGYLPGDELRLAAELDEQIASWPGGPAEGEAGGGEDAPVVAGERSPGPEGAESARLPGGEGPPGPEGAESARLPGGEGSPGPEGAESARLPGGEGAPGPMGAESARLPGGEGPPAQTAPARGAATPPAQRPATWGAFATVLAEQDAQGTARRAFLSRTGADGAWGSLRARVRYDLLLLAETGQDGRLSEGLLGQAWAEAAGARWRVRAGDTFPVLGRGLLLHLAPVPALGVESALRGGLAEGTVGPLTATAFGGITHVVDTPRKLEGQVTAVDNPTAGGALRLQLARLSLAVHGLRTQRPEDGDRSIAFAGRPGARGVEGLGASLEARPPLGGLTLLGDVVTVRRVDGGQTGNGLYGSASLPLGPLTATLEGKRYRELDLIFGPDLLTYNRPPTLEPEDLFFFQPAAASETQGARLLLSAQAPVASLGAGLGLARLTGASGFAAWHGTGSLAWSPPGSTLLELSGGVRREEWGGWFPWASGTWLHAELRVVQPLRRGHALEAAARLQQVRRTDAALSPRDGQAQLAYSFAPYLQVFGRYEHKESERDFDELEDFWAGGITLRPISALLVSFLAGKLPGGRLCSGGTCRALPGFDGMRLEANLSI